MKSAVDDITIMAGPRDDATVPFLGHSFSNEPLAEPPLSRVGVRIGLCKGKKSYTNLLSWGNETKARYRGPPDFVINNEDGSSISMREYITELHAFLQANKKASHHS